MPLSGSRVPMSGWWECRRTGPLVDYVPFVMPRSRAVTFLLAAFALAFAVQIPAHADTYAHVDAPHDVEKAPQKVRAAQYRMADVTHLRIVHGTRALEFVIRLRSASLK